MVGLGPLFFREAEEQLSLLFVVRVIAEQLTQVSDLATAELGELRLFATQGLRLVGD